VAGVVIGGGVFRSTGAGGPELMCMWGGLSVSSVIQGLVPVFPGQIM